MEESHAWSLTTGDIRRTQEEAHTTCEGHDDERSPPGLNDAWSERQGRSQGGQSREGQREAGEEGRQDQSDGNEEDGIWKLEARVREVDARLPRVEEIIYDEASSGKEEEEHEY